MNVITLAADAVPVGSVATIITAVATLVTAIGGAFAVFRVLIPTRQQTKAVHRIVNQQRTDMLRWQAALVSTLEAHGIAIPKNQADYDHDETAGGEPK